MDDRRTTRNAQPSSSPTTASQGSLPPATVAKAALRRLALSKQEPTPENYARAYAEELGESVPALAQKALIPERALLQLDRLLTLSIEEPQTREKISSTLKHSRWDDLQKLIDGANQTDGPAAKGQNLANLLTRLMRGIERGGRQWTSARKKDSVHRVIDSSRSDSGRMLQRLRQLVNSWDADASDSVALGPAEPVVVAQPAGTPESLPSGVSSPSSVDEWPKASASLHETVQHALHFNDPRAGELTVELEKLHQELQEQGASAERTKALDAACERARSLLDHRHHLFAELGGLCQELTNSLTELAEDESWAQGQCAAMRNALDGGISARGVRAVSDLLESTRSRQQSLRDERSKAQDALKHLINRMLSELGELSHHTDRFQENVMRYTETIEKADTLESLTDVVREMVEESRAVQVLVHGTQSRLQAEHLRAGDLTEKVSLLETELKRLSGEVSTDQLTQIANRRGLVAAFEVERAKLERQGKQAGTGMCMALLDVDDFKKLNDSLGHAAGDIALKSLASKVNETLRPGDLVARYGGEEFVLMLPNTSLDEAQQVMMRLQRQLSASLFMHDEHPVFVTFSAGLTPYRCGERLEEALDRADEALYVAKRAGKNRTCLA